MFIKYIFALCLIMSSQAFGLDTIKDFPRMKIKLSLDSLKKTHKKKGLDGVLNSFSLVSSSMTNHFKDKKKNRAGLRVYTKDGKKMMIAIILAVQNISDYIDGSNMHYYAFSKLYKAMPLDVNLAIERSGLSANQKNAMKEGLKNNLL